MLQKSRDLHERIEKVKKNEKETALVVCGRNVLKQLMQKE